MDCWYWSYIWLCATAFSNSIGICYVLGFGDCFHCCLRWYLSISTHINPNQHSSSGIWRFLIRFLFKLNALNPKLEQTEISRSPSTIRFLPTSCFKSQNIKKTILTDPLLLIILFKSKTKIKRNIEISSKKILTINKIQYLLQIIK